MNQDHPISVRDQTILYWKLVTATIMSEHYRKSLLFQGGLEIRCVIIVTMIATVRGHFCFNDMSSLSKLSMLSRKVKLLLALI